MWTPSQAEILRLTKPFPIMIIYTRENMAHEAQFLWFETAIKKMENNILIDFSLKKIAHCMKRIDRFFLGLFLNHLMEHTKMTTTILV